MCSSENNGKKITFICQRKNKIICSKAEICKGKCSFSFLTGDVLSRPPHASCIYLIPYNSHEHCLWLSIAQQAPPAWPAPNEHPAHLGVWWTRIFKYEKWHVSESKREQGCGLEINQHSKFLHEACA